MKANSEAVQINNKLGVVNREVRAGYTFIFPVMAVFVLIRIIPSIVAFYLGFTNYTMLTAPKWVGLKNFVQLFGDELFLSSLWHTVVYSIATVLPSMAISLVLAILINNPKIKGKNIFRVAYYTPVVASFVSVSMIWSYILNPNFGVVNYILGLFGIAHVPWLDSSSTALLSIIIIGIWKNLGYTTIIYLAGLQGVPSELLEAAELDGLNTWKRFWTITWTVLKPTTVFILLINTIFGLQAFDQVFVLTNGGPANSTSVVVFEVYRNAFLYLKMGYAAAQATVLFAMIIIFVAIIFKVSRQKV